MQQAVQFDMFAPADIPVIGTLEGLCEDSSSFDEAAEAPMKRKSNAIKKAIKANRLLEQLDAHRTNQESEDEWLQSDMFAIEWTDEDFFKLMDGVLVETLSVFNDDKSSMETVKEALEWVMSDDILPFSFIVCCKFSGLDYEDVREGVLCCLERIAREATKQAMPADVY